MHPQRIYNAPRRTDRVANIVKPRRLVAGSSKCLVGDGSFGHFCRSPTYADMSFRPRKDSLPPSRRHISDETRIQRIRAMKT